MALLLSWDFDGTLADTDGHNNSLLVEVCAAFAVPCTTEMAISTRGLTLRGCQELLCPQISWDEWWDVFRPLESAALHSLRPYDDVVPALDAMLAAGHSNVLHTSRRRDSALEILPIVGLAAFFPPESVFAKEDVAKHKPDPEGLFAISERFQVPTSMIVHIGDSPVDVEAGKAAGARTVAVLRPHTDQAALRAAMPEFLVADLRTLLPLLH